MPMTDDDYERISDVDWGERNDKFKGKNLFRPLRKYEMVNSPYAYAIKEGDDGRCPFLVNNLCFIHSQNGSAFKPSICQLFPYCFNETPSGVYATVSFLSMGVIHNSGKALVEQHDYLSQKFADFQKLFPDHHPNWSKMQLMTGRPLDWDEYLKIEEQLLTYIRKSDEPLETRLIDCSKYLVGLSKQTNSEGEAASAPSETSNQGKLNHLDLSLISALHKLYFPVKPLSRGDGDFHTGRFLYDASVGSLLVGLKLNTPGHRYALDDLTGITFPSEDKEIGDLIERYFYSRIFAKLYFAAGFGQLSLITGFHHLAFLYALIRWHAKCLAKARGVNLVSYVDVVATIRQLEKRLGETSVGGYAAATMELLLFSPRRLERVLKSSR